MEETKTDHRLVLLGLDSATCLDPEKQALLDKASVLAGPERWLKELHHCPGHKLPLTGKLSDWLKEIEKVSRTESTVVLASGDPNFFGLAKKLMEIIPPSRVQIIPGTSTVQKAFARMKTSWAGVETVSLHGRENFDLFWPALFRAGQRGGSGYLAIYTDPTNTPGLISRELIKKDLKNWQIRIFEDLETEQEKISILSLEEAAKKEFSPLNLVVLELTQPYPPLFIGAPEENYEHQAGLITKSETRAVILGLLELSGQEILWDLGAGSGSVSIEAGRLLPYGRIYAAEKNNQRVAQIAHNRALYGVAHLEINEGNSLDLIEALPAPDRVFFGGGGENLAALIAASKKRLLPKAIIVAAVVGLDSLEAATRALSDSQPALVTQVSIARSVPLAKSQYLKPVNQSWLVKGFF